MQQHIDLRPNHTRDGVQRSLALSPVVLLMALSMSVVANLSSAASDWVEDGQTNFRVKPPTSTKGLAPGHSSDIDFSNDDDDTTPRRQPKKEHDTTNATPYGWKNSDRPDHLEGPEVEVRDDGAGRSPKRKILGGYLRENEHGITAGLSDEADRIMENAPRIPQSDARNVGAAVFRSWLEKNYGKVGVIPKGSIVDVKGQWDDSGHILHSLGLGFDRVAPNQLYKTNLDKTAVIIVDCAGALQPDAVEAVRNFVLNGGYLVTTDWALDGTLARLTSKDDLEEHGFIGWNSGYSYPETVDAIVVDPLKYLVKGCVPYARWRLDDKCQTVHIRSQKVHVLVRSNQLAKSDPDNKGILAATFDMGQGKVLHIVGHFDNNSTSAFNTTLPDAESTMGISLRQGITTNFIMHGLKQHGLLDKTPESTN